MAAHTYDIGDVVRMTAAFTQDAVALDPSGVSFVVKRPDGVKQTFVYGTDVEVVKTATGAYRMDYAAVVAGMHWYRVIGTGTGAAAAEDRFLVSPANALE